MRQSMAVVRIEDPERLDRLLAGTERPQRYEVIDATGADLEAIRDAWGQR
jgi:ribosomal protein L15E